jgi:hypothetical protein
MTEITHKQIDGRYIQIVSADRLRAVLDAHGDDYSRPDYFKPDDEWNVGVEPSMTRYVMIDENSGYVWGDAVGSDPVEACRALDAKCGEHERIYDDIGWESFNGRSGYHVYLAPEEFTDCGDGQDPQYIKMVEAFSFVTRVATKGSTDE